MGAWGTGHTDGVLWHIASMGHRAYRRCSVAYCEHGAQGIPTVFCGILLAWGTGHTDGVLWHIGSMGHGAYRRCSVAYCQHGARVYRRCCGILSAWGTGHTDGALWHIASMGHGTYRRCSVAYCEHGAQGIPTVFCADGSFWGGGEFLTWQGVAQ